MIPVGVSFGTGFAAQMGKRFSSNGVVLITPYTSVFDVAANNPIFGNLRWFMWNNISAIDGVAALKDTCVVALHGTSDQVIPYTHSKTLQASYQGNKHYELVTVVNEDHNSAFWRALPEFNAAMKSCSLVD